MSKNNKKLKKVEITRYTPNEKEGLSSEEVLARKAQNLVNKDNSSSGKSYLQIIVKNVFTFFNMLCLGIAIVLVTVGLYKDFMFIGIVLANSLISIIQEVRAKKTVEKLSIMTAPTAEVIRGGVETTISVDEVVLDDILKYRRDKQICCDGLVLSGEITVNESLLTGESVDVVKKCGDRVYAGSFVTGGNCSVTADKVGKDNYISTLSAKAKKLKANQSPILKTLNKIIKLIAIVIIPLGISVAVRQYLSGANAVSIIGKSAGAIIGMIPSGMFLLTSATLAVGVVKLALKKTLVQDLYCIEMLARCNVLCLDKTGTITDGTMTVSDFIKLDENIPIEDIIATLENVTEDNTKTGDALKQYFSGGKALGGVEAFCAFNSSTKCSGVQIGGVTYVLGASEFVLSKMPSELEKQTVEFMNSGKRTLILGRTSEKIGETCPKAEEVVAVITLADHIREQAESTIKWFNDNNVDVRLISGDNPITVSQIAGQCGVKGYDKYINLQGLSDEAVIDAAGKYVVFGRVLPQQKALIVSSLKKLGKTVAMTGDGVNDILAFKEADCSVAMAEGSDCARSVASLVLLDSDFSNMPKVVAEGRRVVNNIQKTASMYLMKTLFVMIITLITLGDYKFFPRHLTLLGLTVIAIPTFFLAMQPNDSLIKGNFLASILRGAIPSALVMVINFVILWIMSRCVTVDEKQLITMQALAITFAGLANLMIICYPYNLYRGLLVGAMAVMTVGIAILFDWFYEFSPLLLWQYLTLGGLFALSVGAGIGLQLLSRLVFKHIKCANLS